MLENYDYESVTGFDWDKRIISARRARKNEERDYRNAEMGRPPEGQD
jgi:hypothetical protein